MRIAVLLSGQSRRFMEYAEWIDHLYHQADVDFYLSLRDDEPEIVEHLKPIAWEVTREEMPSPAVYNLLHSLMVYHKATLDYPVGYYDAVICHRYDTIIGPHEFSILNHLPVRHNVAYCDPIFEKWYTPTTDDKLLIMSEYAANAVLWAGMQEYDSLAIVSACGPHEALKRIINATNLHWKPLTNIGSFYMRGKHLELIGDGKVKNVIRERWDEFKLIK